jgi:ribosomal protein S18 acetylase RimI-like enzyme
MCRENLVWRSPGFMFGSDELVEMRTKRIDEEGRVLTDTISEASEQGRRASRQATSATDPSGVIEFGPGLPEKASYMVPLICQTAERFFRFLYNGKLETRNKVLIKSWEAEESLFSHKFATVAYRSEEVVGLLIGYSGREKRNLQSATGRVAGSLIDEELAQHLRRYREALSFKSPATPSNAFYITILSVSEHAQGLGVGTKLLSHALLQAKAADCHTLQLDTESDNDAVNFYENMGFRIAAETSVPLLQELTGVPSTYRMVKDL